MFIDGLSRARSKGNSSRRRRQRLAVETLELRQMLAITTTFNAGTLTFAADGADDTVILEATAANTVEYDDGNALGAQTQSGVSQIVFNGGGGADLLIFSNPLPDLFSPSGGIQFNGGAGNDTLVIASGTLANTTGTYTVAGTDSGELRYQQNSNVLDLDFTGLELIQDTVEATSLTTEGSNGGETINIIDGPLLTPVSSFTQGPVILTGGDWEDNDHFANCTNAPCSEVSITAEVEFIRDQVDSLGLNTGTGVLAIGASPDLDGTSPGLAREAVDTVAANIGEPVTHVHATIPGYNDYQSSNFVPAVSGPSSFEDISGTGTLVNFGGNNTLAAGPVNGQFDIGFDFTYYGITDNTVAISTEGYITTVREESAGVDTTPDDSATAGTPAPGAPWSGSNLSGDHLATTPNGTIAGWWENLDPTIGGGAVYFETLGTPGDRRFVVQYDNVQHQGGGNAVTFQIKLFEATGVIEMIYQSAPSDGGTHQVSVEHPLGTSQVTAVNQTTGLAPNSGIRFSPTGAAVPEIASTPRLEDVDLNDYKLIYVATAGHQLDDRSGPNALDLGFLADNRDEVREFVRGGGGLYVNTQQATEAEAGILGWLEIPDLFVVDNLGAASQALSRTQEAIDIGLPPPTQPSGSLAYHQAFLGPAGLNGLDVLVVDASNRWITIGQGAINETIGGGDSLEINGDLTTIQVGGKAGLVVNGNGGDDAINIGQPGDSLDVFGPALSVDGGGGTNSLSVDDSGDLTGDMVTIDDMIIDGLAPFFPVDHTSFASITVTTTASDDQIDVDFTAGGPVTATVIGEAGDDVFGAMTPIQPSLFTNMTFLGGDPDSGPNPVTPPGDQLNLDMTIATEEIIIDTVGGLAFSISHLDILFGGFEDVDAVDVEDLQVGDLFVEGTPTHDRIVYNQHNLGQQLVTINNVQYGPFFPFRKLITYAGTGNDFVVTHDPQPLPVDFRGEGGNDYLASGIAGDTLLGGIGNDILLASEGDNFIDGGTGNDQLEGRSGADIIFGSAGNDDIITDGGNDIAVGGPDNDTIDTGFGNDFIDAGAGDDVTNGYIENDVILGGIGDDILNGDRQNDLLIGEDGADVLRGEDGQDVLIGDDFNATLRAQIDADLVDLLATYGQAGLSLSVAAALDSWFTNNDDSAFRSYTTDDDDDLLRGGIDIDVFWATGGDDSNDFRVGEDIAM